MAEFSQGVCGGGAAILKDGAPMTPEQIVFALRALNSLVEMRDHKDKHGKTQCYLIGREIAWDQARAVFDTKKKCKACDGRGYTEYYHDAGDHFGGGSAPFSEWVQEPCKACKSTGKI